MLIKDVRDKLDITPGLPEKEFVIRCYAMDLFKDLIEHRKLIIFDDLEELGTVTENHLLKGLWDWETFSMYGESLFWTNDITMRLFGKKDLSPEELRKLTNGKDLMSLQAEALKEAAQFVLATLEESKSQKA